MQKSSILTCRAILFDLDGTLIDSTDMIYRLWEWWANRHGIAFDGALKAVIGRPAVETIRLVAPHLRVEDEIQVLEAEEVSNTSEVRLIPGARELLASLDSASWAIVTSGSLRVSEARIRHVGLPVPPVLVTADHVARGKPSPDAYLLAAERLGVAPDQCIVVEDSPVGVQAGKAAGMRVIAIASSHPAESLRGADAVIARLTDMQARMIGTEISIHVGG